MALVRAEGATVRKKAGGGLAGEGAVFPDCHSAQPYLQNRTAYLKKHAAAQRKFVSVCFLFLPFGEPLNRWPYAMLLYRSFYYLTV